MGCSASKRQLGRDERNVPLTRSLSLPGSTAKVAVGSPSRSAWRSDMRGNGMGGTNACAGQFVGTQQTRPSSKLKPVKEEDLTVLVSPTKYTRNQGLVNMNISLEGRKVTESKRFASFGCAHADNVEPRAYFLGRNGGNESGRQTLQSDDAVALVNNRASSFTVMDSIDGNSGLRLLLSPVVTPSKSFTSSTRNGTVSKTLSSSCRFSLSDNNDSPKAPITQAAHDCKVVPLQTEGVGDSEDSSSPLFDPSILATFEKAVEALSDEVWQISDGTPSSSSRVGCTSSDTCSDAESLDWHKDYSIYEGMEATLRGSKDNACKIAGTVLYYRSNGLSNKKPSVSRVSPIRNDAWSTTDYLEAFDLKCPPGCEDKIVLYFTSLRGIRKTYEDCCTVRLILKGFGVHVDERDVWMHSTFRQELTKVVGSVSTVPRLFVKGRYIGGVEEVKRLHEEGILGSLLEGLPAEANGMCDLCGGVRFIPCTSCSGSCKVLSFREVLRCPDCNENGLMMCPSCYW